MKKGNFSGMSRKQKRNRIIAITVAVLLTLTFVLGSVMMFFA
jgi:hypothetical protein